MRASRILAMRPRAILTLSQLCEEKTGDASPVPPPSLFVPPRLSVSPQSPFNGSTSSIQSRSSSSGSHSPKPEFFDPGRQAATEHLMPEHMAPKRSPWTSPPPPEASPKHHAIFQDQLDQGIALATASASARDCAASTASGDSIEILNDEESRSEAAVLDDLQSIRSFNGRSLGESLSIPHTMVAQPLSSRGRLILRPGDPPDKLPIRSITDQEAEVISQKADLIRRSQSGPPSRKATNRSSWPSVTYPVPVLFQTSPSIRSHHLHVQIPSQAADTSTVFYETAATRSPSTQEHTVNCTLSTYPTSGSQLSSMSSYHLRTNEPGNSVRSSLEHDLAAIHLSDSGLSNDGLSSMTGATGSPMLPYSQIPYPHRHVPSIVTTTPHPDHFPRSNSQPSIVQLSQRHLHISSGRMNSRSPSQSPLRTSMHQIPGDMEMNLNLTSYPFPASYINCPSTPSSASISPTSPTTRDEFSRYSSPKPSMHLQRLKSSLNPGQHTIPSALGSVNLAGSSPSVTPLR